MKKVLFNLFNDERDRLSSARVFFTLWTGIVMYAAWHPPAEAFWPVAASVLIGLLSWAAGPRIAQYLAPQAGAAAKAAADAVKKRFGDVRTDDERGL
jgi:hypothetical protein